MKPLFRQLLLATAALSVLSLSTSATLAQATATTTPAAAAATTGTAAEARAMLDKAIAALKADKAKALEEFNAGTGGFKDRDLYVYAANASDNVFTAHPKLKGTKITDLKDKAGRAFGEDIVKAAQEGKVNEVSYMFPKPGSDTPVPKVSFVTKVGDQIVGVGYYK